jgi:Uma2 family endonuclease
MATLTAPAPSAPVSKSDHISFRVPQIQTLDDFYIFCQENPTYKFERSADGTIDVMPNTGGKTGMRNSELNADVIIWNRQTKSGIVFDSSTAFFLPDGSTRSPDVAWISRERWDALTDGEQEKFPPVCPDFIIELVSPSDSLNNTKKKMQEVWMANGCRLAWLIDPKTETTHIFRANGEIQIVPFNTTLSGEEVLTGFTLQI